MHKWWGNGLSGVLTQTIWSTLTLATQINTLNTQTEDGTDQNKQRKLKMKLLTQTEQNNRHHTHQKHIQSSEVLYYVAPSLPENTPIPKLTQD